MFRPFSRFSAFHRFAALLALLAMLVPLGTALTHHPAGIPSLIRICGLGYGDFSGKEKAPTHKMPSCPVCQSMHLLGGGFIVPPPLMFVSTGLALVTSISIYRAFLLQLDTAPQARPRAPPIFA
jgi:hypothetical protein